MRTRWNRGVLLVDVLIASFILSVGLMAVVGLFVQVGQAGKALNQQETAAYFAQDGMERLRHFGSEEWTAENLADVADTEWLEKDGVQFERAINLHTRPELDPNGNLVEAEVRVSWRENTQLRQMVLLTYFVVDTSMEGLR